MALLALAVSGAATPLGEPPHLIKTEVTLTTDDNITLAGTLYTPNGAAPEGGRPAIVFFHAIGGKRQDLENVIQRFGPYPFEMLALDARGHGQSQGLTSIDGPREIADARTAFEYLASQPGVNPHEIGAWGISLGGGAVLRSLVEGVPWAAVETAETWTDLYSALAPQNLSKSGAIYQFLNSVPPDRLDPSVAAIVSDSIASKNLGAVRQFAAARSTRSALARVHTPVLMFQGRRDFAFDIDQATAAMRLLKGPKELYIGDFGHSPSTFPGPDFLQVIRYGRAWFQRWLEDDHTAKHQLVSVAPDPWRGRVRSFKALPATRTVRLSFGGANALTGEGKAIRTGGRTDAKLETFGAGRLHLQAKLSGGWQRLVAVLTATTPKHKTIVVSEGGVNTTGLSGRRNLTIRLISDATLIPSGSRLTLTLASSSMAQDPGNLLYLDLPQPPGARVRLGPARLDLPVLRKPISR